MRLANKKSALSRDRQGADAKLLLTLCLVLALPCVPQTPARRKPAPNPAASPGARQPGDPANRFPLESLKITGNQLYTAQQILAVAGLKIGDPVAKDEFEQARKRLTDTGAFESVGLNFGPTADGKGYAGTFEVVEVGQLYPFRFEGLPDSDRHLREALKSREPLFADRIPGTKQLIDRFAYGLQTYLGDSFKDKVKAELAADKPGELTVVFRPATSPPAVAEVEFTGNKVLPASTLHNTLAAVATGLPYREETIRGLLDTSIRPLYDGRGRLKVVFGNVESVPAKNVDGVRVKVSVDEGPVYNFGTINSAVPIVPPKKVVKMANLKSGEVANFDMVSTAVDAIQKELRKEGYIRSHTQAERAVNDKEKTVDITFTSVLGTQFHMGKLNVSGLDVVTEPAIRKLWSMKEGNPYNADYPQFFLNRVKEDGYLDNLLETRWDQSIDEKTATVDVSLYFRGGTDPEIEKRKKKEREQQQQGQGPPIY